jgi:hypothetical protein
MRKTEAGTRARIESNRDQVPVELWSRAPMTNGIEIPRVARTWTILNPTGNTDQEVLDRQRELIERRFRLERTVDLVGWDGKGRIPS